MQVYVQTDFLFRAKYMANLKKKNLIEFNFTKYTM